MLRQGGAIIKFFNYILVSLFVLGFSSCAKRVSDQKYSPKVYRSLIINGQEVDRSQFASVAMILFSSSLCTGTLIHPLIVLTAAHCLYGQKKKVAVKIEYEQNKKLKTQIIESQRMIIHEKYKDHRSGSEFDIGIIILKEKAKLPENQYLKLLESSRPINNWKDFLLVGYGWNQNNMAAGIKRMKKVKRLNDYFCYDIVDQFRLESAINSGDSGGPIFIKDLSGKFWQAGIMSTQLFGVLGFCNGSGGLDIRYHLDWITEKTGFSNHKNFQQIEDELKLLID